MKLIPKKTFLLKQINEDGRKPKDVIAHKGVAIEVSNEDAVKFAGYWVAADDSAKKKINEAGKANPSAKRIV